jgi:hypothetical protein
MVKDTRAPGSTDTDVGLVTVSLPEELLWQPLFEQLPPLWSWARTELDVPVARAQAHAAKNAALRRMERIRLPQLHRRSPSCVCGRARRKQRCLICRNVRRLTTTNNE